LKPHHFFVYNLYFLVSATLLLASNLRKALVIGTIFFTKESLELGRHCYSHSLPFPDKFNVKHHTVKIYNLITEQKLMEQIRRNTPSYEV